MGAGEVYVTDKIDERLHLAKSNGACLTANPDREDVVGKITEKVPELLDVVFECCGQQDAIDNAVDLLKPGGLLMVIGIPEFERWSFPVDKSRHKELCIQNVRRQNEALRPALDLMASGEISVAAMATHRFSFEDSKAAFDLVAAYGDGVMKAMWFSPLLFGQFTFQLQ